MTLKRWRGVKRLNFFRLTVEGYIPCRVTAFLLKEKTNDTTNHPYYRRIGFVCFELD